MVLKWFLLTACVSCCVIQGLCSDPSIEILLRRLDSPLPFGTKSGYRPCVDETCSSVENESVPVDDVTPEEPSDHDPENQVVTPNVDVLVQHCMILHNSTIYNSAVIEARHPDVDVLVQLKVIKGLVDYVSQFSALSTEDCDPAMKLLDFIILAAEKLKQDYSNECGKTCNYTTNIDLEFEKCLNDSKMSDQNCNETARNALPDVSTEGITEKPCSGEPNVTEKPCSGEPNVTEKPCPKEPSEEMLAEEASPAHPSPPFVGSIRGIPGVHYPNYTEVPITSFSCADKKYVPGFYADLETGCQVFHVCYEHRRESLLCPVGTIFNQPILACDYWYSSNCSVAPEYYEVNANEPGTEVPIDFIPVPEKETDSKKPEPKIDIKEFLPIKATITEFKKPVKDHGTATTAKPDVQQVEEVASEIFHKIVSTATDLVSKTRGAVVKIPEPTKQKIKPIPLTKSKEPAFLSKVKFVPVKAKFASAIPIAKVAKSAAAAKAAVPIAVKAKLAAIPAIKVAAAAKAAVPIAVKAKLAAIPAIKVAAAAKAAVPIAIKTKLSAIPAAKVATAAKVAVPIAAKAKLAAIPATKVAFKVAAAPKIAMKAKISSALPLAKAKIVAPALKGKALKSAALPIVKAKLAKTAAISPLTKKALALGYMKLLKAKKVALMG